MKQLLGPTDHAFLLSESDLHPMNVGGLLVFSPPDDAASGDIGALWDAALGRADVAAPLRRTAYRSLGTAGLWAWRDTRDVDLARHVHRHTLPPRATDAGLFRLCAWLHGRGLDRDRPLWEMHLIDGLPHGRFAVYAKLHHSLTDGVAAMALLRRGLTDDAERRGMPAPWEPQPAARRSARSTGGRGWPAALAGLVGDSAGVGPALAEATARAVLGRGGPWSISAPRTVLNQPITATRAFAARSWPLERVRLIAKRCDCTINDVVLALCSGALRDYLSRMRALPHRPLIAMVPVSLRGDGDHGDGGNRVGTVMCNLGTELSDPAARLHRIVGGMREGKRAIGNRGPLQITAVSALGVAGLAPSVLWGRDILPRPPFNVVISNVPGPDKPLYWNGALLEALHPLSIPVTGQALNITCTSNHDRISFGLTAARTVLPRPGDLLRAIDRELAALEGVCD